MDTATQQETQELVENSLAGCHDAFAALVDAYQQAVYNVCYRILGDPFEAEDAAQEAFLRAYQHLDRYDVQRSFKTWLLSIASNHCIDRLRRRRLTQLSLEDLFPSHPALASHAPGPEEHALDGERCDCFQEMLETLPANYRIAVVLYYWYDMPCNEIAAMLGTREGTVKSRLYRARRQLGAQMQRSGVVSLRVALGRI